MIDSPRKGVRKIFNALVGPWIANRECTVNLLHAQAEKDRIGIGNGTKVYRNGRLLEAPTPATVVDAYDSLHTLNHMSDARRLQASIEEAIRQISDVPPEEISDEPISQTFFNRWRREAEMIDEEDLRVFWSKLLVEQTKNPESISPRTLDVARNLSRDEARLFERMAKFVSADALLLNGKGEPPVGQYVDILKLINAGVVGSQTSKQELSGKTDDPGDKPYADILFTTDGFMIRCFGEKVRVSCHLLTNEGVTLMKLLDIRRSQEDIVNLAKAIANQTPHQMVSVHVLTQIDSLASGQIQYHYQTKPVWMTQKPEQGITP